MFIQGVAMAKASTCKPVESVTDVDNCTGNPSNGIQLMRILNIER